MDETTQLATAMMKANGPMETVGAMKEKVEFAGSIGGFSSRKRGRGVLKEEEKKKKRLVTGAGRLSLGAEVGFGGCH